MLLRNNVFLKYCIMFCIFFTIGMLDPFGQMTRNGMLLLGLFTSVIFGWISIGIIPVSMYAILSLSIISNQTPIQLLGSGFSNQTILMILVSAIFAGLIEKTGCLDIIAKYVLTSKFIQKSPWNFVFCIFLLCIAGRLCNVPFAAIFLLWNLVLKIVDQCGYERKSAFVTYMIAMISMITISTGMCFPWNPGVMAYYGFFDSDMFFSFSHIKYILISYTYLFVFIFAMIFVAKYIMKMDISELKLSDDLINEYRKITPTRLQKVGLFGMILFILVMLLSSFFSYNIGLIGVIFIFIILFSIVDNHMENKIRLDDIHGSIPWTIIWLLLAALPLTDAMKSSDYGIMITIMQFVNPLFLDTNVYVFMSVAVIFVAILTQISNNFVVAAMFMPIFYNICVELGGNTYVFFIMLLLALNCDVATPAGSMNGAMVHGHAYIDKKYAYLFGSIACVITIIICIFVLLPLGMFIC